MARGAFPIGAFPIGAGALALVILALVLGPLPWLLAQGAGFPRFAAAELAALRFTLGQAALSALLSCLLAVPLARALARRAFPGRGAVIALMGAPFLMPVIAVALGIITVWGPRGWLAEAGLPLPPLYGLQGVVLAHVFLNLPLATRMILLGWQSIPAERFRLAAALDFDAGAFFAHLERPMLRAVLPGAFLAIFLVCLTSFTLALTLGGGPRGTTLELAIYQAVRFDFDLPRAALLALLQFGLCALAALAAARLSLGPGFGAGRGGAARPLAPGGWRRGADAAFLAGAGLFLALPLAAVLQKGFGALPALPSEVWPALIRSLTLALPAGFLAVAAALVLAGAVARGARGFDLVAMLPLAASPLVLALGLFLIVFPFLPPAAIAGPLIILVNAVLALPFAFRLILPEARALEAGYGRLAAALGLRGAARFWYLTLPRLRRALGFALGLCAALALGDLGAVALLAGEGGVTLPLLIQRLMGAYRMEAAAGAAFVLMAVSFTLFWLLDRWGRRGASV